MIKTLTQLFRRRKLHMFQVGLHNNANFMTSEADHHSEAYRRTQFAASMCYQPSIPDVYDNYEKLDVEKDLFNPGHHTTMQHASQNIEFVIDNIPVSLVTFGLHMGHPFYNSSQRSGRYCKTMFDGNRDVRDMYIKEFIRKYTDIGDSKEIIDWVNRGIDYFNNTLGDITRIAKNAITIERPYYKGNIDIQAKRIAQDQLRCVISTIAPTGLVHSLNTISLAAVHKMAWNRPMKALLSEMVDKLKPSDFDTCFTSKQTNQFCPTVYFPTSAIIHNNPPVNVLNTMDELRAIRFILEKLFNSDKNKSSLDIKLYDPNLNQILNNISADIRVTVEVPVVTFGQDQRHRTIRRSNPIVTGGFYLPTLLSGLNGAYQFCKQYMDDYLALCDKHSSHDMIHFIPYGAMVQYTKQADPRSYVHSFGKRLCWNAESCISKMERFTLQQIYSSTSIPVGPNCDLGFCNEGSRSCGRDIKNKVNRDLL